MWFLFSLFFLLFLGLFFSGFSGKSLARGIVPLLPFSLFRTAWNWVTSFNQLSLSESEWLPIFLYIRERESTYQSEHITNGWDAHRIWYYRKFVCRLVMTCLSKRILTILESGAALTILVIRIWVLLCDQNRAPYRFCFSSYYFEVGQLFGS